MIRLNLKTESKIYFKTLPKSATSLTKKILNFFTNGKTNNEHFIYYGKNNFGKRMKQSVEINELYKGKEYVITLEKGKSQTLMLKPFHGIYNFKGLETA